MTNYLSAVGVQQFSIVLGAGVMSGTTNINAVGPGAFILSGGNSISSGGVPASTFSGMTLTNPTTITAVRQGGTAINTLQGCIFDGDTTNLIKSVQYTTVTIAPGSATGLSATLGTTVDQNYAVAHLLGINSLSTLFNQATDLPDVFLVGSNAVAARVTTGTAGLGLTAYVVVIEFQPSALNQPVQYVTPSAFPSSATGTATINSVVMANTILVGAGFHGDSGFTTDESSFYSYAQLTDPTTVTNTRSNPSAAGAATWYGYVVEFAAGVLKSAVQRNTTTLAGQASNTSTLSPSVDFNNAGLSYLGNLSTQSGGLAGTEARAGLTNSSTVTISAKSTSLTSSWEVPEFLAYVAPSTASDPIALGMSF